MGLRLLLLAVRVPQERSRGADDYFRCCTLSSRLVPGFSLSTSIHFLFSHSFPRLARSIADDTSRSLDTFWGEKEEINEMDLCRSGLRSVSRTSGPMASISLPPAIVFSLLLTTLFSSHPVLFSLKSDAHRCVCIGRRINRKDTTNTPATVFFCPVPFIYFDFTLQRPLPPSVMCSLFSDSFARTRRMLASRRPEFLLAVEIEPHSNCCSGGNQRTKSVIMDGTTVHSVSTEFWACHNHRNAFVFCN